MTIQMLLNDPLTITGELRLLALAVDHYQTLPGLARKRELTKVAQLYQEHEIISLEDFRAIRDYVCESRRINYAPGFKPDPNRSTKA